MKKIPFVALFVCLFAVAGCNQSSESDAGSSEQVEATKQPEENKMKTAKSGSGEPSLRWSCEMLGMYSHNGTAELSHNITRDDEGNISGGTVEVDMKSILVTDDNFDPDNGKTSDKLISHLKSSDFFDVENYPSATFEILSINQDEGTLGGLLTIKGVSQKKSVPFRSSEQGASKARFKISRSAYGITWQHPIQDNVLSDEIEISIQIES